MIEGVTGTFKYTTPAVNQEFVRKKIKLTQAPVTGSHARKVDISIMFFEVTPFCCPRSEKFEP